MEDVKEKSSGIETSFKPTILVVDDDETVVEAVEAALESKDYRVISANSGEEALKKFEESKVDIIVSDIKMPEINGLELLRKVKERKPSTRVIMMTAYASVDSAVEAMREGASDYIRKPIEVKDIRTTILGAVENLELEHFKEKTSKLVKGRGEEKPYQTFNELIKKGKKGLCISKNDYEEVRKSEGIDEDIDFVKLSEDETSPDDLNELEEIIRDKISDYGSLVILIDSLDYLLESNSLDEVKKFVNGLEKDIVGKNSTLIISGDPDEIDEEYQEELEYMASDMPARVISDSLSNHIRRKVITQLDKQDGGVTFTSLSKKTGIDDSPKLSFHLRKLESKGLIKKDEEKRYYLTEAGENAAETLEKLREIRGEGFGQVTWIPK